jgi:hypothetical protein
VCVPCSHRHSFDRQTARRPSPCPQSSLASATPSDCCRDRCRHAAPRRTAPHRDRCGMGGDACARAQGHTLLKGRDGCERSVVALAPSLIKCALAVCAIRRLRCMCTCNTSDFEFSISPPTSGSRTGYVCTLKDKCELSMINTSILVAIFVVAPMNSSRRVEYFCHTSFGLNPSPSLTILGQSRMGS